MNDPSGKMLKGYEIRERLGAGGFGAVYKAYQPIVNRDVAVKVILPEYANQPDFIRRFDVEAQLVAKLEHPHIVPLFDYWRDPDGAYLVMRLLRGGSLRDALKDTKPSVEKAIRIVDQMADALFSAHRSGIVHRDLKPDNILLDDEGNAYLNDFGIAATIGKNEDADQGVSGTPAYMAPEQITGEDLTPQTDIYAFGIILYELVTGEHPFTGYTASKMIFAQIQDMLPDVNNPDIPSAVNRVIQKATEKDPKNRHPDILALANDFKQAILGTMFTETTPDIDYTQLENPYKGLRAFQESDALDFFGRETLVAHLVARLSEDDVLATFLAVIGPSGSGKSSVVKAGLLPALRAGTDLGSENWFIAEMAPGSQPLEELEVALLSVATRPVEGLAERLRSDKNALTWAATQILPKSQNDLLLVIDQFEELFTQVKDEAERVHFLDLIRMAVTADDSRVRVIVTLRADFTDKPLQYVDFGTLIQRRTEFVLPMNAEELERVITNPALRVGAGVDTNLIAALVTDVRQEPGALPLLQYALTEVFERRDGAYMTLAAYQDIGGITGALARRAEEIYTELSAEEQTVARQLFLRLVTVGEGTDDTRRRARMSELLSALNNPVLVQRVLDSFGRSRLLTFDRDPDTREPTIEVAHEALIREWIRLRQWMDTSRADIRLQRLLANAASEWERAQQDVSFLASGSRLTQFEELAENTDIALAKEELTFLQSSIAERARLTSEKQAQETRERELKQQARNRQRIIFAIIAASLVGAVVLIGLIFNSQQIAQQENERANIEALISQSGRAALQAQAQLDQNRVDTSLLLSMGAIDIYDTREARSSLLSGIQSVPQLNTMLHNHTAPVRSVAYSPDGARFATADEGGTILIWNTAEVSVVHTLTGHTGTIWEIAFSPDGEMLASVGADGTIRLWDVASGSATGEPFGNFTDVAIYTAAFSPDGQTLATGQEDNFLRLWDVETRQEIAALEGHQDFVLKVRFNADGTLLASGDYVGEIILWDVADVEAVEPALNLSGHTNSVTALAFSPDGQILVSGSADRTVRFWNSATGQPLFSPLTDHTNWVRSVEFSPDGMMVASASADSRIILRDAETGLRLSEIAPLEGFGNVVWSVAFSPDGMSLLSGGQDDESGTNGKVLIWSVTPRQILNHALTGHRRDVFSVAINPAGTQILSGSRDSTVQLQDAATGALIGEPFAASDQVVSVAFSPDGQTMAYGAADGSVSILNAATDEVVVTTAGHDNAVRAVVFSPDGSILASAGDDNVINLWSTQTGERISNPLTGHNDWVWALAFSPDGSLLASGSYDNQIILWDVESRTITATLPTVHTNAVTSLAFSHNGQMLASASRDQTVILWDVAARQIIGLPMLGHTDWVHSVAFSPDDAMLVSGSADDTLILWDVPTRQPIGQPFAAHTDWVWSVAFSPDGSSVISGGRDGAIFVWDVRLATWRTEACRIAHRNLTEDEWSLYLPDVAYREVCSSGS